MRVQVKLYGSLRDHLPAETKGKTVVDLTPDATVASLLAKLGIEHDVLTAINQEHKLNNLAVLKEGDYVTVFEMTAGG